MPRITDGGGGDDRDRKPKKNEKKSGGGSNGDGGGGQGSPRWFAREVLEGIGAPTSGDNITAMLSWMTAEGGHWNNSARYNPLNTTQAMPGYEMTGEQGNIGRYTSWEQGVEATVTTLKNGRYGDILTGFRSSDGRAALDGVVNSPWGTKSINYGSHNFSGGGSHPSSGGGAGGGGPVAGDRATGFDKHEFFDDYKYAAKLFDAVPELNRILKNAVAGDWSKAKTAAKVQSSDWFRTHSAAQREWLQITKADSGSARRMREQQRFTVRQTANQMGVNLEPEQIKRLAEAVLRNGLNEAELSSMLAAHLKGNDLEGQAGATQDGFRALAGDYGLRFSDKTLANWTQRVVGGKTTAEDFTARLQELATSAFPALTRQIKQGQTVREIAEPYLETAAASLEVDPDQLDLRDRLMRQAFGYQASPQAEPALMPLWEFEKTVRSDKRWLTTKNAHDTFIGEGTNLLRRWGVMA